METIPVPRIHPIHYHLEDRDLYRHDEAASSPVQIENTVAFPLAASGKDIQVPRPLWRVFKVEESGVMAIIYQGGWFKVDERDDKFILQFEPGELFGAIYEVEITQEEVERIKTDFHSAGDIVIKYQNLHLPKRIHVDKWP